MGRSLVVAAALAALLLAASPARADGPALSVPADRLAASLDCPSPLDGARTPVLVVPGTGEDPEFFAWNYLRAFRASGTPYCTVTLPEHGTGDIQVAAEYLVHAIRTMHARAGRRIAVLGHSQGGMAPRWALRWWPDTRAMVDDLVGLAASNHGTDASRMVCSRGCNAAAWQQGTGSRFLRALNAPQETWAGISYTSPFTRFDEIVFPNQDERTGSTALRTGDGAISNPRVQDICPANTSEHLVLGSSDPVGYALTVDALSHAGPADPARIDRAVCAQPFQPGVNPATFATDAATSYAVVVRNFSSGAIVSEEPPLKCYVTGTCGQDAPASPSAGGDGAAPPPERSARRPRPRLVLAVRGPRRIRAGRRVRLRVLVRDASGRRVRGARVRVGGRSARTGRRGRATLRRRFARPGRRVVRATRPGYRPARVTLRVVRARKG